MRTEMIVFYAAGKTTPSPSQIRNFAEGIDDIPCDLTLGISNRKFVGVEDRYSRSARRASSTGKRQHDTSHARILPSAAAPALPLFAVASFNRRKVIRAYDRVVLGRHPPVEASPFVPGTQRVGLKKTMP
ncbi:hypothetical protein NUW58_g9097 [Xylaria curta]|uniref:Uncharacterized protein n=1 Tax=Xylaria curta TaxID=42375 RepID=A0ACC1N0P6_9PEZI|nr:hypothetical protein NUW58_g9097 [Xylaria curta]